MANMGRMSGLPQHQVCLLSLNTESNSTGFSFQPWETDGQMNSAAIGSQRERSRSCAPTLRNGTDVLVEASDESDMARAGLRGDASVRHAPGTSLFYHPPKQHTGKHNLETNGPSGPCCTCSLILFMITQRKYVLRKNQEPTSGMESWMNHCASA